MNVTLRGPGRRGDQPAAIGSLPTIVLLILATAMLAGCSQLAGALSSALPAASVAPAAIVPSAAPGSPRPSSIGNLEPGASSPGGSAGGTGGQAAGGKVGSHAIVCLQPATPSGGGGPPCVPVGDALMVSTAMGALSSADEAAIASSGFVAGAATACAGPSLAVGCRSPDAPQGIVTFQLRNGSARIHVLVFRRADGSLGATRLA